MKIREVGGIRPLAPSPRFFPNDALGYMNLSRKNTWVIGALFFVFLVGMGFRFWGLQYREPSSDEGHYRSDMSNIGVFLERHQFRDHSVRHRRFNAPHGLVAQYSSYKIGWMMDRLFGTLLPEHSFQRHL